MRGRVARILSTALITAGLVVVLDTGITLAAAEPVSTLRGWLAQRDLSDELEELERRYGGRAQAAGGSESSRAQIGKAADRLAERMREGEAIGRMQIPAIGLNIVVVHGTEDGTLRKGPGQYPETALPGQRGTVGIAGHRTTYLAPFRRIDRIGDGDEVIVEMPYATFTYRFERQRIVDPSAVGVVRDVAHDRIVLTACHPLYSAAQRIVVFARLVEVHAPGDERERPGERSDGEQEIAEAGLGPSLAGAAGLALISALMWLASGRRRSPRPIPDAEPGARDQGR